MCSHDAGRNLAAETERFAFGTSSNPLFQYGPSDSIEESYLFGFGSDKPLAMRRNGQSHFHLQDMLANATSLTSSSGAKVESYQYSAFGKQANPSSPTGNRFTFAGREWDQESATYYNRARQLDPSSGRFTSEDPIASSNAYPYAGSDPVSSRDPTGLFSLNELNSANSIRGELASEQVGFGLNLIGAFGGDDVSASDVAVGVGVTTAGGIGAFKLSKLIRSLRAARRFDTAKLVDDANKAKFSDGLTHSAHALDSDYARMGMPKPTGNVAEKNESASQLLDEIVNSPGTWHTVTSGNFRGGIRRISADGRTATWDADGVLRYFAKE